MYVSIGHRDYMSRQRRMREAEGGQRLQLCTYAQVGTEERSGWRDYSPLIQM